MEGGLASPLYPNVSYGIPAPETIFNTLTYHHCCKPGEGSEFPALHPLDVIKQGGILSIKKELLHFTARPYKNINC